jgi:hypothetical protein
MFINSPYDHGWSERNLLRGIQRAVREAEERTQREVEAVLPSLLPLLPQEAMSLTRRQWELLYYVLYNRLHAVGAYRGEATVVCVLQALEQCAGKIRLPYAWFYARAITFLWATEEGAIGQAAERCLPLLQAQIQGAGRRATRSQVA